MFLVNKADMVTPYPPHSFVQQVIMLADRHDARGELGLSVIEQSDPAMMGRLECASRVLGCPNQPSPGGRIPSFEDKPPIRIEVVRGHSEESGSIIVCQ